MNPENNNEATRAIRKVSGLSTLSFICFSGLVLIMVTAILFNANTTPLQRLSISVLTILLFANFIIRDSFLRGYIEDKKLYFELKTHWIFVVVYYGIIFHSFLEIPALIIQSSKGEELKDMSPETTVQVFNIGMISLVVFILTVNPLAYFFGKRAKEKEKTQATT